MNGPGYVLTTWDGAIGSQRSSVSTPSRMERATRPSSANGSRGRPQVQARMDWGGLSSPGSTCRRMPSRPTSSSPRLASRPRRPRTIRHSAGKASGGLTPARSFIPIRICPIVLRANTHDQNPDGRATITLQNASSNHPGGVNVLFMDGSVRFIKSSVGYQALVCHRDPGQRRDDQFRLLLRWSRWKSG